MKRRVAIKNLTFAVAGVLFVPGCNFSGDNRVAAKAFLSSDQDRMLKEIIDSIIPGDETVPGAGKLKVEDYVKIIIADCHGKAVQEIFLQGLEKVESLSIQTCGIKFADLQLREKEEILTAMETAEEESLNQFYALVKGLSIQGFMTSQYIMTNFSDYKMVPGPEYCCIEVSST